MSDTAVGDLDAPPGPGTGEVRLPRLGPGGWLRWAWRQLTSMRTALLLLLLLAVAAVPGSVFPQRRINPGAVQTYLDTHTTAGPLLDRLGFFDVYTSPWFSAIYLLLFVSLVGCVLPRSRVHLAALRAAPPRTPGRLSRLRDHASVPTDATPEEALEAARAVLRRRRYRVASHDATTAAGRPVGPSLAAERGHLAESGNLVFHLSLLGLLVAVATGSMFGYSGQVLVVEGERFANAVPNYDSFAPGSRFEEGDLPPLSFTLDQLSVRFDEQATGSQFGAARQFDAALTVQDRPGADPREVTVRPNEPLDADGARAFLVGNGYAPVLTVRDERGRVVHRRAVPFLPQDTATYESVGVVKVPDAQPRQIALTGLLLPTALLEPGQMPRSIFPDAKLPRLALTAFVSRPGTDDLGVDSGVPQWEYSVDTSKLQQLKTPDGEPYRVLLAPGATAQLPDGAGTVTFEGLRRYGVFDVRHDPGKELALIFAGLALAGVTASLFVRRRRLWVRASAGPDGRTVVEAAGLARGEDTGLAQEVAAVLAAVGRHEGSDDRGTVPAGQG